VLLDDQVTCVVQADWPEGIVQELGLVEIVPLTTTGATP